MQFRLRYGAHDIELVFLVPVWVWLWTRFGPRSVGTLVSLALMLVISVPKVLLTSASSGLLIHWRSMAALALLAWVVLSVLARAQRPGDADATAPA